jgi:hypothetical protein
MAKNVRIEGLDEVLDMFRRADGILAREGKSWLRDMGNYGVDSAQKHILNVGAVDTNELIQGMHYKLKTNRNGMQVTVRPSDTADEYAVYMEEGTKPHMPPRDALQGWADRHGIPVFLVQKAIAENGTEPRYMFRDTFEDFSKETEREAPRFVDAVLRRLTA